MAIAALYSSASGLSALSTNLDIIANNLANVNTTAFKSSRANFEDLLYEQKAQPGVENASNNYSPAGLQVGTGTRISNTQYDFSTGSPISTSRPLDMMINGNGFFRVSVLQNQSGDAKAYTRAGNLFVDQNGNLVLGNTQGPLLDPPIKLPANYQSVAVSADGLVTVMVPGQAQAQQVGQLQLYNFINPSGMQSIGGNLYIETPATGDPVDGKPGDNGFGTILQNTLEASNVDPVNELVGLITTQRAFEMNSQSIQAANETLQVVDNLRKG